MKRPARLSAIKQRGVSLIELMVSMAVGLIISAGAAALFANTILSSRTLNSASQINEQGLQIANTLTRHLRMTGYVDWLSNTSIFATIWNPDNAPAYTLQNGLATTPFQIAFSAQLSRAASDLPSPIHGCDTNYVTPTTLNAINCVVSTTPSSAVTIAYQVRSTPNANSAPSITNVFSNATGMSGDCNNQEPGIWPAQTSGNGLFVLNRFYLKLSDTSVSRTGEPALYDLMCQGNGSTVPQPLFSNVEQFLVTYGIAQAGSANNDSRVGRYLTASEITAANAWGQVIAVNICVLVVGERGSATSAGNSNRNDCFGNTIRFGNEQRLRQSFVSTVSLRNQTHTTN